MKEEFKVTLLNVEKEKEIRFNLYFKLVLAISIGLSGILSLGGITYLIHGISEHVWINSGINTFLFRSLFYISIIFCFIALVTIAIVKRPFSKMLIWCSRALGMLFILSSIIFPRITGYKCSGFYIFSKGDFTLIDGTFLIIGLIGILFSLLIKYGFIYQTASDMVV